MAAYISFQPSDYFNTLLYTGNGASGNAQTGVGFQPDMIWIKNRNGTLPWGQFSAPRGIGKILQSNTNSGELTDENSIESFDADGFTIGTDANYNTNTSTYLSWNWKGGTTTGITTDGNTTITPTAYSFNQTSGFSVVKYTGNLTSGAKIAHGLGATPKAVIVKRLDSSGEWDQIWNIFAFSDTNYIRFTTGALASGTWAFNDTFPDAVNFTVGDNAETNSSGGCVAYCFAEKNGYCKIGQYEGSGNANGPFSYTGFRPAYIMIKQYYDSTQNWWSFDNKRLGYNPDNDGQNINLSVDDETGDKIDFLSNGFKLRSTDAYTNQNGTKMLFIAFAEFPFVSSNSKPTAAR